MCLNFSSYIFTVNHSVTTVEASLVYRLSDYKPKDLRESQDPALQKGKLRLMEMVLLLRAVMLTLQSGWNNNGIFPLRSP